MKFLELRQKDVINCNTGECLGFVLDLEFEIPYKCIVRIGRDTILVDINEKECLK